MKTGFVLLLIMMSSWGCSSSDSGVLWKGGPYVLTWIDHRENVFLAYDFGSGGGKETVAPCVFAVGFDGQYVVVKQHPNGDRKITNYFIVNAQKDSPDEPALGPFTEAEFQQKSVEMKLPRFTKVIKELE
jgi:hypothetical protein